MTVRQRILKFFYPILMKTGKKLGRRRGQLSRAGSGQSTVSFYDLDMQTNQGKTIHFSSLKGKKVLLVNTASACGYTAQYAELQMLADQYPDKLVVLAFPSNDFGEQEKGSDDEIASFCRENYGINFPIAKKSHVLKSADQDKVFRWLTNKVENGWNDREPGWNFSKYLIDENGSLVHCFEPGISPLDSEIVQNIEQ